jgi:hypothetical protein
MLADLSTLLLVLPPQRSETLPSWYRGFRTALREVEPLLMLTRRSDLHRPCLTAVAVSPSYTYMEVRGCPVDPVFRDRTKYESTNKDKSSMLPLLTAVLLFRWFLGSLQAWMRREGCPSCVHSTIVAEQGISSHHLVCPRVLVRFRCERYIIG